MQKSNEREQSEHYDRIQDAYEAHYDDASSQRYRRRFLYEPLFSGIDLAGKPEEVFLAQYAGTLEPLSQELQQAGWALSPSWTWRESLPYLNPNATLTELPPRPALHEGLKAKLTMVRTPADAPEQREVLRAYKTDLATASGEAFKPIYLLSLTREIRSNGFHLYAIPTLRTASADDIAAFRDVLGQTRGLSRLAQHERSGSLQDLVTAIP